jgi:DNA-binding transcriptional LysR family regulator
MELRHLRYLVAVAENLNFRRAAERLRVSQTALTIQIQDLEAELGVRLLDRDTRGVHGLTAPGKEFVAEAIQILQQADRAVARMKEVAQGGAGRLVIGNIAALSAGFTGPALERFSTRYPQVDVTLASIAMVDHPEALAAGQIDIGFSMGPREPFPKSIRQKTVLSSPLRVVLGPTHPLARREELSLRELGANTLLCLGYRKKPSLQLWQISRIFTTLGLSAPTAELVDSFESLLAHLVRGRGYSLLPELTSKVLPRDILVKPISDPLPDHLSELSALWRVNETSPIIDNFLSVLSEA